MPVDRKGLRVIEGGKDKPKPLPVKQRLHTTMACVISMIEDGSLQGMAISGVTDEGNPVAFVNLGDANACTLRGALALTEDVMREMLTEYETADVELDADELIDACSAGCTVTGNAEPDEPDGNRTA